jgi:hypothetical protein
MPTYRVPDELKLTAAQMHLYLDYCVRLETILIYSPHRHRADYEYYGEQHKKLHKKREEFYGKIREKYPELLTADITHKQGSGVVDVKS